MSGKFVLFLTLLLCSGCRNEAIAAAVNASNLELQSKNGNTPAEIQFLELNFDVLHLIVDTLDLPSLMNIAQTNSKLHSIANKSFRAKYQNYEVSLDEANYKIGLRREDLYREYKDDEWHLHIFNDDFGVAVLQLFGSAITKLGVYRFDQDQKTIDLHKMTNTYCADTLVSLDMSYIQDGTLEQFTMPFKKLELFSFIAVAVDITGNVMPFSQLFPNLHALKIDLHGARNNYDFIDHMSTLEELHLSHGEGMEQHCEAILRRNQQIRRLNIRNFPGEFINYIEKLPDLQELTFENLNIKNDDRLYFENVKYFKLSAMQARSVNQLAFARLESLDVVYDESDFNNWRHFLGNNQNITKLRLVQLGDAVDMHLVNLLKAELPKLQHFELASNAELDLVDILD